MVKRSRKRTAARRKCSLCGRVLRKNERYIKLENENLCALCVEELETWQIVKLLHFGGAIDIFTEKGKTRRA